MTAQAAAQLHVAPGSETDGRCLPLNGKRARISPGSVCTLLREDPELAEAIPEPRRTRALEECTSRTARIAVGSWGWEASRHGRDGIGLLVLEGLAASRVSLQGRCGLELLGEGDLLSASTADEVWPVLPVASACSVLLPLRVALLDRDFVERHVGRYPELATVLVQRALRRSHNLAVQLAIVNQPRVEDRLLLLLWHLASRWGRVGRDEVLLDLRLTHAVLAELVAARRPSVSQALSGLASRGIVRRAGRGWALTPACGRHDRELGVVHTCNGSHHPDPCGHRR
ncbi:MAG TPA: Crp/Fnr family transcriptional regulator [Solirubrobacteraceae bacterium]|nr:Crp/Fnr family transcriptional regulator [Solirubrobacteraceae bacterium]